MLFCVREFVRLWESLELFRSFLHVQFPRRCIFQGNNYTFALKEGDLLKVVLQLGAKVAS